MQRKQRFRKKVIAWLAALTLAVQPAAGAMIPAVTVKAADRVPITSITRFDAGDTVKKDAETGKYSFAMPKINSEALTTDNFATYEDSYEIQLLKDGTWVNINEVLGENLRSEDALTAAEGNAYCISFWDDGKFSGWGLSIKLDESMGKINTIRFQSLDYEKVYLDYKLVEVGAIETLHFEDASGKDTVTVGAGTTIALNFDYLRINEGEIGGGQYGQGNFEWKAVVGGNEKEMAEVFGIYDKDWGWDYNPETNHPANGGYWFPVKESVTIRAKYIEDPSIFADYTIIVQTGTKGPEYDSSMAGDSKNVADPGTNKSGYKLVWQDEFNGNYGSANVDAATGLNLDNWSYQLGDGTVAANNTGWGNAERQSYSNRAENIEVKDGLLRITAKYEKDGYTAQPGKENKSYYSSARIVTKGDDAENPLFTTTYGYVEARMALPETVGAWPAFWMLPQSTELYGAWPVSGEIDIMETCGFRGDEACATLHWGSPDHVYLGSGYEQLTSNMRYFHTYAVDWEPGKITFIYDGTPIYTQTNWESKIPGTSSSLAFDAPFDQPYYILLNLAVDSGLFGGSENTATFQDDINMYVDYVRVYHKNEGYNVEDLSRAMQNSKTDWASKTGNQIAELQAANLATAEGGDMNAMETDSTMEKSKWYLAYTAGGAASIDSVTQDGTDWAKIQVTSEGTENYATQLIGHYDAKAGYLYKISFDAYAEGEMVGKTASCDSKEWKGWGTYGVTSFELESTPTSYSFLIDQQADFNDCRIEVNLGKIGTGTAYISNVKVEIVDPETIGEDSVRSSKALANGEVLYNGTFDQGKNRKGFWTAAEGTNFTVPPYTEASLDNDLAIKDIAAGITKHYAHRAVVKAEEGTSPAIYQSGFSLPAGEYTLTFDLYSQAATTVNAALHAAGETGELGSLLLDSKTSNYRDLNEIKQYAWTFTTKRDLKNAAIVLSFGDGADVQIDNVSLLPKEKAADKTDNFTTSIERGESEYRDITYEMKDSRQSPAVNADANPDVYVKGEGTIVLADPVREGYEFAGWSLVEEPQYVEDYVTEVSTDVESITLYANWGERVTDTKEPTTVDAEKPVITEHPSSATYEIGTDATVLNVNVLPPTGNGTLSYQWYSGESEDEMEAIPGATESRYQPDTLKTGVTYYYCLVTNTDESATGEKAVSERSRCISITVKGLANAQTPLFTAHPQSATYNLGGSDVGIIVVPLSVQVYLAISGSVQEFTFQWYGGESEDEMEAIPGATESSYTPDITKLGKTYYYCEVTNTNNEVPGNKTAKATSKTACVEVNGVIDAQTPIISENPRSENYEAGAAANPLSVTANLETAGTAGELSYQWYSGASEDEMEAIPGATERTYVPDTSKAGVTYYYCVVTNTNEAAPGEKTAQKTSETAKITVNGKDASTPLIMRNPVSETYTYGQKAAALMIEVFPVTDGALSYQWYTSASAQVVGTPIAGATTSTYTPSTMAVGQKYYYCVVKNTNMAATGAKEVTTKSNAAAINVVKAPGAVNVVTEINKTYGNKAFSLNATGFGTLTYTSSNSSIVTVNAGTVTIKNTGKATITVYASGDANHHPATAQVTINVAPKRVTGVKVKSSEANKATITWKKDKKATGYQIQYATNSKFKGAKTVTISKNKAKKPSKTISKLKAGKKYYVRVRSFKNKSKATRVNSAWSAKKKVTIMK